MWAGLKLLPLALLLAFSSAAVSPDTSPGTLSEEQRQTLQRLAQISTQLAETNAELRSALSDSRTSYRELQRLYAQAGRELEHLSNSLQTVEMRLVNSAGELAELRLRLQSSRSSLESLRGNLKDLEAALRKARFERWLWALAGVGIGAAGGVTGGLILGR